MEFMLSTCLNATGAGGQRPAIMHVLQDSWRNYCTWLCPRHKLYYRMTLCID